MANVLEELEKLSVAERLQLVEDLWDSIARSNTEVPIPQWQKDELARRKEIYLRNPDAVLTWDQAKRDILQSR
ncbi:MAG: putative addiction module component [Candidatus Hydrogenedentes bacterium ADurb.Bin101]|jgi:putative addiction module component (TIGR02574 family)|nr:MAG: putative addiction module component [Candidatus Hydrogenedentes bacterium ADurb.Bin101]HOC70503.1 addiction module protein [Candidatus Hydrogenedentota bacterium]